MMAPSIYTCVANLGTKLVKIKQIAKKYGKN